MKSVYSLVRAVVSDRSIVAGLCLSGLIMSMMGCTPLVSKLNAYGTAVVYTTYLGGDGDEAGNDIAVDAFGYA